MSDCLFCKIAAGEIDAELVAESDQVVAFDDIDPQAPTHVLVIPRTHIASAADLTAEHAGLLGEMFSTIAGIARDRGLTDGFRVVTNSGAGAGQSVDHLHFHLLGGRSLSWPPG